MALHSDTERTFTTVTVPADPDVADVHDRIPLILKPRDWPTWLGETEGDPTTLLLTLLPGARCGSGL
jgi:putative SOS response-associated peptidase YedK